MNLSLKNISYNARLSEETSCFAASIYVDGKKAGEARNNGQGGATSIYPAPLEDRIDAYAKTLPPYTYEGRSLEMNAEMVIDNLLTNYLQRRDMKRAMRSKFLFTKPGVKGVYAVIMGAAAIEVARADPEALRAKLHAKKILNFLPEDEALALYAKHS
jgi:hypothetical protein